MATSVEMPELGESVTEGTITTWLKKVGDTVEVDEPLLEVSTDKVDTEIPSPVAGVLLEILADEDDTVDVGEVIRVLRQHISGREVIPQQPRDSPHPPPAPRRFSRAVHPGRSACRHRAWCRSPAAASAAGDRQ